MPLIFGAIADDLTGGLELAAMIAAGGVPCDLVTDVETLGSGGGSEAIVVAQKSRVAPAEEAKRAFGEIGAALRQQGARQMFFKYCATFDSTDRGNIGPCADVLREITGAPLTPFCPSFPEVGRRVFQGHLFVDGQLLSESPKRHDPLTPMTDSNLVRVLQRQTAAAVGMMPEQVVRAGGAAMKVHAEEMIARGLRYAIVDAATPEDLKAVATLTVDWPLSTGNSSVAAYYPALWRERGWVGPARRPELPGVAGPGVVLAGSVAERTLAQLDHFGRSRPVLAVDLGKARRPEEAIAEALEWALPRLAEGPVAIATSADVAAVEAVQALLGQHEAARLAEDILSGLAAALRDAGVRRFLIAGGETSGAIVKRLGIRRLKVGPFEEPGISRAVAEGDPTLALSLKSGKLGPVDMFLPVLERLQAGG